MSGAFGRYDGVRMPNEDKKAGSEYTANNELVSYFLSPEEIEERYGPVNKNKPKNHRHKLDKNKLEQLLQKWTVPQVADQYKLTEKMVYSLVKRYGLELDDRNRIKQQEEVVESEPARPEIEKELPLWVSVTKNLVLVSTGVVKKLRKDPCRITVKLENGKLIVKANGKGYKMPDRDVAMQAGGKKMAEFLRGYGYEGKYELTEEDGCLISK